MKPRKLALDLVKIPRRYKLFIIPILMGIFLYSGVVYSQDADTPSSGAVLEQRARLEEELRGIEIQIDGFRSLVQNKREEASSLERDIAIIDAQIKQARLAIRARTLTIQSLTSSINNKSEFIGELSNKYDRERASLAELLRQLYEFGDVTMVEMLLGYDNLSDFFVNIDSFDTLQQVIQDSFDEIRTTKAQTEEERSILRTKKEDEYELKGIQELEKKRIEQREAEKQQILRVTRGDESLYRNMMRIKEKSAAQIRSQLFLLRGSDDIPFEKALDLANNAYTKTGVRPAFLLGVITQETNLGQNIGQCLLTNIPNKGDGKGKNTGRFFSGVMKATRDVDPFIRITKALGLDFTKIPVSCPPGYGYGGGMGPAQFIPSTWAIFESRIARGTGHNPPNPWDPGDAFMASAIYLSDLGADRGTRASEWEAAMRYFAGGNWKKIEYGFYGDAIMEIAEDYQQQINILSGSN